MTDQQTTAERILTNSFELGTVVMTSGIAAALERGELFVLPFLFRHASGDWGDMGTEDKLANDRALEEPCARIFSAYETGAGKIWIITEWDRSSTCILFPSEY